jgi:archaellum component FlaC
MALLERISIMKKEGKSGQEIIKTLGEEGISPRQINEALSQSDIKSAVSAEENMQPSIMQTAEQTTVGMPSSSEANQEISVPAAPRYAQEEGQQNYNQQLAGQEQYTAPEYSPQDYMQGYDSSQNSNQGYVSPSVDIETIRDIANQIIEESMGKLKEQLSSTGKMKTEINTEIQEIDSRLKKVEDIIQQLQFSIIKKMGDYGEAVSNISKEVRATQDSFSKLVNPIMDKKRGIQQEEQTKPAESQKRTQSKGGKSSASFEDYLR